MNVSSRHSVVITIANAHIVITTITARYLLQGTREKKRVCAVSEIKDQGTDYDRVCCEMRKIARFVLLRTYITHQLLQVKITYYRVHTKNR